MAATVAIDQLRIDTDARAHPPDAAFEDEANVQFTRDLLHVHGNATIPERGRARAHRKEAPTRELGNDVLGDSVAEIILLRITAHVGEGEHADRNASRLGGTSGGKRVATGASRVGTAVAFDNCADCTQHFLHLRPSWILLPMLDIDAMQGRTLDR